MTFTGRVKSIGGGFIPFNKMKVIYNQQSKLIRILIVGRRYSRTGPPYEIDLLDDLDITDEMIQELKKQVLFCYEKQKRLSFENWKKQKSWGIESYNYHKKHWPSDLDKPRVKEWVEFILPLLRKRK